MDRYLEDFKKTDEIIKQMQNLRVRIQTHDNTKHLTTRSQQRIIDQMILYKLRNVGTYIRLAEMGGWCLGETTSKSDGKFLKHQFNIQLLQLDLQKRKLKQQKQIRVINTPSTEMESISENKISKSQKMQKVLEEVRAKQTPQDIVKIEEYFQSKKVKKYQNIHGWVKVDQSRLRVPIDPTLIDKTMKFFTQCWQEFAIET